MMLKIAYSPVFAHPLPEEHRFPMQKYELIPKQLLDQQIITQDNLFCPQTIDEQGILSAHTQDYWHRMKALTLSTREMRAIGFPLSKELIAREVCIVQGTIECSLYALKYGVSLNIAGGTHHAFADKGEGFCLLNDFAIAAYYLLNNQLVNQILIVDLDVHQGNGTASIFRNNTRVYTFSMHGAHNYPFRKEQSDLDVALADGTDGTTYLNLLETNLTMLLSTVQPDMVFYLSGVDVLNTDRFGKLDLSIDECKRRDEIVFALCHANNIPVTVAMGGGYSPNVQDIITAHCNTFKLAKKRWKL